MESKPAKQILKVLIASGDKAEPCPCCRSVAGLELQQHERTS